MRWQHPSCRGRIGKTGVTHKKYCSNAHHTNTHALFFCLQTRAHIRSLPSNISLVSLSRARFCSRLVLRLFSTYRLRRIVLSKFLKATHVRTSLNTRKRRNVRSTVNPWTPFRFGTSSKTSSTRLKATTIASKMLNMSFPHAQTPRPIIFKTCHHTKRRITRRVCDECEKKKISMSVVRQALWRKR